MVFEAWIYWLSKQAANTVRALVLHGWCCARVWPICEAQKTVWPRGWQEIAGVFTACLASRNLGGTTRELTRLHLVTRCEARAPFLTLLILLQREVVATVLCSVL